MRGHVGRGVPFYAADVRGRGDRGAGAGEMALCVGGGEVNGRGGREAGREGGEAGFAV